MGLLCFVPGVEMCAPPPQPLEWVGGCLRYFYQGFFSSAGRIDPISSLCALPPERMTEKPPLTVCTRPPAAPGHEDEGGVGSAPLRGAGAVRVLVGRAGSCTRWGEMGLESEALRFRFSPGLGGATWKDPPGVTVHGAALQRH